MAKLCDTGPRMGCVCASLPIPRQKDTWASCLKSPRHLRSTFPKACLTCVLLTPLTMGIIISLNGWAPWPGKSIKNSGDTAFVLCPPNFLASTFHWMHTFPLREDVRRKEALPGSGGAGTRCTVPIGNMVDPLEVGTGGPCANCVLVTGAVAVGIV